MVGTVVREGPPSSTLKTQGRGLDFILSVMDSLQSVVNTLAVLRLAWGEAGGEEGRLMNSS